MSTLQTFEANDAEVPAIFAFVAARCRELELAVIVSLRLQLIAEEIFTNTLRHGLAGVAGSTIGLAIERDGNEVVFTYEDSAGAYDPFVDIDRAATGDSVEHRPVGGLGRILVHGLARRTCYERVDGRNRITLRLDAA